MLSAMVFRRARLPMINCEPFLCEFFYCQFSRCVFDTAALQKASAVHQSITMAMAEITGCLDTNYDDRLSLLSVRPMNRARARCGETNCRQLKLKFNNFTAFDESDGFV